MRVRVPNAQPERDWQVQYGKRRCVAGVGERVDVGEEACGGEEERQPAGFAGAQSALNYEVGCE